jgi:hypothetical protein
MFIVIKHFQTKFVVTFVHSVKESLRTTFISDTNLSLTIKTLKNNSYTTEEWFAKTQHVEKEPYRPLDDFQFPISAS